MLNGKKCFVPNGGGAETYLVYAREGEAEGFEHVQAFIVPAEHAGLTVGDKEKNMGVHALDSVELALDDVQVPADARLGGDRASISSAS